MICSELVEASAECCPQASKLPALDSFASVVMFGLLRRTREYQNHREVGTGGAKRKRGLDALGDDERGVGLAEIDRAAVDAPERLAGVADVRLDGTPGVERGALHAGEQAGGVGHCGDERVQRVLCIVGGAVEQLRMEAQRRNQREEPACVERACSAVFDRADPTKPKADDCAPCPALPLGGRRRRDSVPRAHTTATRSARTDRPKQHAVLLE